MPVIFERDRDRLLRILPGFIRGSMTAVVERKRVVAIVDIDIKQRQVGLVVAGAEPAQFAPQAEFIAVIGVIATEKIIPDKTITFVLAHCNSAQYGIAQRSAERGGDIPAIEIPQTGLCIAAGCGCRIVGAYIDHAGQCVGPKTRPLWPTQHFHLVDIQHDSPGSQAVHVHIVDGDTNRREVLGVDKLLKVTDSAHLDKARPGSPR